MTFGYIKETGGASALVSKVQFGVSMTTGKEQAAPVDSVIITNV